MKECFHRISKKFIRFVFCDSALREMFFWVEIFLDFFGRNFSIFVVETPFQGFFMVEASEFSVDIFLQRFAGRIVPSRTFW